MDPGNLLEPSRCRVMGVVNVTPDSFSDGGRWLDADTAVAHGLELVARGADLIDVGGESTRPGAGRVDEATELDRILPVVRGLVARQVPVSVDTMRASVASHALEAGAAMINDVSGGRADPAMVTLMAQSSAPVVLMHWRAHSEKMDQHTEYADLVVDVVRELMAQVDAAAAAGVSRDRIVIDPGLGFSKTADQNWEILANLSEFMTLGHRVLVAASRKRFLSSVVAGGGTGAGDRDNATAATSALAARAGAWGVRVHEAAASADAVRVVERIASFDQ